MTSYTSLGLQPAINASGRMTALGGSVLAPPVIDAMSRAATEHVVVADLVAAAGARIAELIGAQDVAITSSASAGIASTVAALIAGVDPLLIQRLPAPVGRPSEVVLQKGHAVDWGAPVTQMIALGGGVPVEVGSVNRTHPEHIESAIGPDTAALLFVQSHHTVHKGMLSFEAMLAIGRRRGVPVIVDAAAEEDLRRWTGSGADAVVFSGTKAIGAPASGLVAGGADLMRAVRAQTMGIARPMKVGKEQVLGLVAAVETFLAGGTAAPGAEQRARMTAVAEHFAAYEGVDTAVEQDDAGRDIHRAVLTIRPASGTTAAEVARRLAASSPPMFVRDNKAAAGQLAIDPRPLTAKEEKQLIERLDAILTEAAASTGTEHTA